MSYEIQSSDIREEGAPQYPAFNLGETYSKQFILNQLRKHGASVEDMYHLLGTMDMKDVISCKLQMNGLMVINYLFRCEERFEFFSLQKVSYEDR